MMIRRDLRQILNQKPAAPIRVEQRILEDKDFENAPPFAAVLATKVKKTVHNRVEFMEVDDSPWRDCHNEVLLTIRQVCRMFDITTMTVYHWVRKLGLPKQVLGGGRNPPVRYDEGQLLAWGKAIGESVVNPDYLDYR